MLSKDGFATYNVILWFVTILVSICLLGTSFSILAPWQYGVTYNKNILYLETDRIHGASRGSAGRRFTGLGVDLLKFPKTVQTLEFSYHESADEGNITCRTQEGLPVNLGIAMQYILDKDKLPDMFLNYGGPDKQKKFLAKYARGAIRNVCVKRPIVEWFPSRTELGEDMMQACNEVFKSKGAIIRSLQLLYIGIPFNVQKQIEDTAVAAQGIQQAEYNVSAERVRADTRILKAVQNNKIIGIESNAFANATIVTASAAATALNLSVSAEIDIYKNAQKTLNLTKEELLAYMWIHAVRGNDQSSQVIEVGMPSSVDSA